jgi:hypothetical protein
MISPVSNLSCITYNTNNRNKERGGSKGKISKVVQPISSYANEEAFSVVLSQYLPNSARLYNAKGRMI